jgi:hypothetical protein
MAEIASALLMLCGGKYPTAGNEGSPISFMPFVVALDGAGAGGSISEERMDVPLLSSDRDEQLLLVLLPSPLLRRRKRYAMVLGQPASPSMPCGMCLEGRSVPSPAERTVACLRGNNCSITGCPCVFLAANIVLAALVAVPVCDYWEGSGFFVMIPIGTTKSLSSHI